jgi:hypothetical protein
MELQQLRVDVQHLKCEVADAQVHITELETTDSNEAKVEDEEDGDANTDITVRLSMFVNPTELCAQTHLPPSLCQHHPWQCHLLLNSQWPLCHQPPLPDGSDALVVTSASAAMSTSVVPSTLTMSLPSAAH